MVAIYCGVVNVALILIQNTEKYDIDVNATNDGDVYITTQETEIHKNFGKKIFFWEISVERR